jgi:hypothetical protein
VDVEALGAGLKLGRGDAYVGRPLRPGSLALA